MLAVPSFELDADGGGVEVNDGELGLLVEADRRRAERELPRERRARS